jgi:predicted nucleotidyltransferase
MLQITSELLNQMTQTIVQAVHPEKIVLFGSCARGTAHEHSDMDLIIVEAEAFGLLRSRRQEMAKIWRLLKKFPIAKDILVYSNEEIELWKNSPNHLISRALKEGRSIYERN